MSDIKYISDEIHQMMIGTEVVANDLLLNITGGSLGRCAVIPSNFEKGNVSQHVCILRPIVIKPEFLHCFILSSFFAKSMKITGSGREGLPKYNLEKCSYHYHRNKNKKELWQKQNDCRVLLMSLKQVVKT